MVEPKSMMDQARAVVLSKDHSLGAEISGELALTCVPTAYEAAAELLASPTLALVVDLRALSSRHARLLEIARQLGVEMLAVGQIPAWAADEALSSVRIVSRKDLPAALRRLVELDRQTRSGMEPEPIAAEAMAVPAVAASVPAAAVSAPGPAETIASQPEPHQAADTLHDEARREFEADMREEASRGGNGSGTYVETITQAARRRLAAAGQEADPVRKAPIAKPPASAPQDGPVERTQHPSSLLSDAELTALLEKEQ